MLLQEPQESPYDLRFQLLGFPVRVSWTFWLGAIIFGHSFAQLVDFQANELSPGIGPLLVLWTICLFVSILIHELGHALAFRQFGIQSSIVLYHFGGLAVPIASFTPGRSIGRLSPQQDLWVTFAGPLAQIVSAAVVIAIVKFYGYRVDAFAYMPAGLHQTPGMLDGAAIDSVGLYALVTFYVFPSVLWALLNLMPVWPLDGGRITRSIVLILGGTTSVSLWISVAASGALAAYAFKSGQAIMGMFFLMFAITSFQLVQQTGTWR
ncbi:MAG: peptidase [Pirellulaceae bacterium]|nr:peptidase [Pirellulaceae bacterium]